LSKLDIIISVIVLIPALFGLKNGFLRNIFSLTGIITGLILATRYNDKLLSMLGFIQIDKKILSLISFILIIIIVTMIFKFISDKISGFNFVTKTIDKILGLCLGIMKGVLLASIFLLISTNTFNVFSKPEIDKSIFYNKVVNVAPEVYNYFQVIFPNLKDFYEELNKLFISNVNF